MVQLEKPVYTKQEVEKMLLEHEQEWRFNFLKQFQANLTLSPEAFEKLLNEYIKIINLTTHQLPGLEEFRKFLFTFLSEDELKKNSRYDRIYNTFLQKLQEPGQARTTPPASGTAASLSAQEPAPPAAESVEIKEVIVRPDSPFNPTETEVMTALLKKFFNEQITAAIQKINPSLAPKVKNNKLLYDYRTFFQILNKIVNPTWIDNDRFFEKGWQDFVEVSRKMYMTIKKDARITNIRPGINVKNFTKSNFYGMLLTTDYCADEVQNPKLGGLFNFCMKYFTLSFEREPDEMLEDVKFFNYPYVIETFKMVLLKILNKQSSFAPVFLDEMNRKVIFIKILNSREEKPVLLTTLIKKIYYISLIYNFSIKSTGQKDNIGYKNAKGEPLVFSHPQVISHFKDLTSQPEWTIDKETSQLAVQMNMFLNSIPKAEVSLLANLFRGIIESIKVEVPLLNATSLVRSKNIKQGMEKELTPERYHGPVIKLLMESREAFQNILESNRAKK